MRYFIKAVLWVFFLMIFIWIAFGYLRKDFSLTITFIPFFYFSLILFLSYQLFFKKIQITVNKFELYFFMLHFIILSMIIIAWFMNFNRYNFPISIKLFNFIIPFTVFIMPALIWLFPLNGFNLDQFFKDTRFWFFINILASIFILVVVNIFNLIPESIFYFNPQYNISLYSIAGEKFVRNPGIFESGATNGTFLLIFFNYYLSQYTIETENKRKSKILFMLILLGILIFSTITRRAFIGLGLVLMFYFVLRFIRFKENEFYINPFKVIFFISFFLVIGGLLIYFVPDLFDNRSLLERVSFWQKNLNALLGDDLLGLITGFGILQASLPFLNMSKFFIIDNLYLAVIIYGGVFLLLIFLFYFVSLFYLASRYLFDENRFIRRNSLFIILTIIFIFFNSFFASIVFSLVESFFVFIAISLAAKSMMRISINSHET